ncbi:MAG: hypothetical protein ACREMA_18635, partial [Longimicrobiales bacterium]
MRASIRPVRSRLLFVLNLALLAACADRPTGPSSALCEVKLTRVATLGPDAGSNGPQVFSPVARSARGHFYVAGTFTEGAISVFDSAGVYLRSFGRKGKGPGENGSTDDIRMRGDTLFVRDRNNSRISLYLVPGGECLKSITMPRCTLFTLRGAGGMVVVHEPRDSQYVTVEVRNTADSATHSFAVSNAATASEGRGVAFVEDVDGQSIWLAFGGQYLFERYSYEGERLDTIASQFSWFVPPDIVMQNVQKYDTLTAVQDLAPG